MNSKFEKFKSKEISQTEAQSHVGGDYIECYLNCSSNCLFACSFANDPEICYQDCTSDCGMFCLLVDMDD